MSGRHDRAARSRDTAADSDWHTFGRLLHGKGRRLNDDIKLVLWGSA